MKTLFFHRKVLLKNLHMNRLFKKNHNFVLSAHQKLFIKRQKKAQKKLDLRTWCTKKPFGYKGVNHRVVHRDKGC